MKQVSSLFLISLLLFLACGDKHSQGEHGAEDALHGHHHGSANDYMNERPFEELVASFDSEERDAWQKPDAVIAALGELSGKTVVDIGAGSGYFVFRLAPLVGKVIGVDIDKRFLAEMEKKKAALKPDMQSRIEIRPTDPNTPRMAPGEADIVLVVDTYHHIENRKTYFQKVQEGLKPGGKLVVIDFKEGELPVGPPDGHKLPLETILSELASAGYKNREVNSELLPYQHIVTAW